MKRFNYNTVVFICVTFLIITSLFSRVMISSAARACYGFLQTGSITKLIDDIDKSSKIVSYKNLLIDLQSLKDRLMLTREINKEDTNVIRLQNDYLCYYKPGISDELIKKAANACVELKNETEALNIPFMYIYAPLKSYYDDENHVEYRNSCDKFLRLLDEGNVHVLNIAEKMKNNGISMEEAYFITDHHWNIETAFWAYTEICSELKKEYNFQYDDKMTLLENYNVKVYNDWFLGSQGKKTGRYFTPLGVDDVTLITPKFDTNLTVESNGNRRIGSFDGTILRLDQILEKDYYNHNCYGTYSGGDFPLQIIENNLACDDDKKILIIRDSFACAVSPFLSLNAKSIHCIDIRTELHGDMRIKNVFEYIKEYDPDYVMILYSGLGISENDSSRYDFK